MCGIAGIINLDGVKSANLNAMSQIQRHRGPDDEGFEIIDINGNSVEYKGNDTISQLNNLPHILEHQANKTDTVGLVHRRLSILDLTAAGHQPMQYNQNKYSIVFNGEIYNYKELKNDLIQYGFQFKSDSDTEVILASYQYWGQECVTKFVGMWSFVLFDIDKKELFISRDRFGIKPFYFYSDAKQLVFASEIKALLSISEIKPEANMTSVFEYISFGATADSSANLFKNVNVLPPAHNLVVNTTNLQTTMYCYYTLSDKIENYKLPSQNNIQEEFNACLNNSINLHLRADVAVGSTLSGGLDSSTIVGLVANKMDDKLFKTFTAAYHQKEIDESNFAKKVTSNFGNVRDYYTYPTSQNYWQDIDKLIWHQDLPINSTSMFAQWEVMKLANQQNIKVLLDGQGADEILGGYYNFAGLYLIEKLKHFQLNSFFKEKSEIQQKFSPNINNTLARALYYYTPEFVQRKIRAKKRLGMGAIASNFQNKLTHIDVPARGGKTFKEQSLLSVQFGLQDLLRYEDRNSMAFSIESRVPFLDHRLVELSIALNNDWKINNGWTKYILRKTAEPILPSEVVWRKYKMGFLTPQQLWKNESKVQLTDFINNTKIPDFINKEYLLKLNESNIGDSSHLSEFWKIISFLKWAEIFKVTF